MNKGEELLAKLDDWGIKELRRHKVIWSAWGPMMELGALHQPFGDSGWGMRELSISEPSRLRMFCLGLLWRAAATAHPGFSEIKILPSDLGRLRELIVADDPGPADFYPATFIQMSSLGEIHNQAPFAGVKKYPATDDDPEREVSIFRFYFDGLVIHIHNHASDGGLTKKLGPLMVSDEDRLLVSTVKYEISFQRANLMTSKLEAVEKYPEKLIRLLGR